MVYYPLYTFLGDLIKFFKGFIFLYIAVHEGFWSVALFSHNVFGFDTRIIMTSQDELGGILSFVF